MKRIDVNRQTLEELYPAMDERFERNMRAMIDTLPARREKRRAAMKPRYALAFALLLMLLCVTALAAYTVHKGFLSDMAELNVQAGAYDEWTLEEKENIVRSMKEYGVITDTAAWDEALALPSQKKREKALDALFSERYGVGGRTDVITALGIVEKELGLYDSEWSLEQKAAYTQLMLELDLLGYDTNIDFLPDEDDIPREEAVRIAKEAVQAAYGYDDATMDSYDIWTSFLLHRREMGVKKPYYMMEFFGPELEYHVVSVSGEGKVLTSEDGYKGVSSPAEEAARLAKEAAVQQIPETARFASHAAQLELLDTQIYTWKNRIADGVMGLSDKTAVVFGRTCSEYMAYNGAFVECIGEDGQTKWSVMLPQEGGEALSVEAVMELEGGDMLAILQRQKAGEARQSIEYIRYDQLRIAADGTVIERKQLKTISDLTGKGRARFEQMYAVPGHGGMLVSGYMGGKNIPAYAQLDENGETRFTWSFEDLLGYAPYLKVTDEGYVLCAWNEAANRPILRFYDRQGRLVREGTDDPALAGIRINRVKSDGNGGLMATSNFMENGKWLLARIDGSGMLLDKQMYEDDSGPILLPTEIAQVNGRYVYAANHHLSESDWTNHTGVIISDAAGAIREYSMQGADDFSDRIGYLHLAPVGGESAMLAYTMRDDQERLTVQLAVIAIPE